MNQLTICTVAQRLDSWLCLASSHKLTRSHGFNPKEDPFLLTILQLKNGVWYAQVSGTASGGFNVGGVVAAEIRVVAAEELYF